MDEYATIGLTTISASGSMHIRNWPVPPGWTDAFAAQMTARFGAPEEMVSDMESMEAGGQRLAAEGRAVYLLRDQEGGGRA
jgi:hypothetical protein